VTKYTVNNGLSGSNVRNLVQDPFGYMWIATEEGLNRFTGKKSLKYSNISDAKHKTLAPDIRAICYDSTQQLLYVLNCIKGFSVINPVSGNIVKEIPIPETGSDNWNITMTYACRKLWIGSNNGLKIYDIATGKFEILPNLFSNRNKNKDLFSVWSIFTDSQCRVWVFVNNYGILVFNGKSNALVKIVPLNELYLDTRKSELRFTSVIEFAKDNLLIGTSEGLKQIVFCNANFTIKHSRLSFTKNIQQEAVSALTRSKKYIFIATSSGLYRIDNNFTNCVQIQDTENKQKSWLKTIHYMYVDQEENVWAACEQGLSYLKNSASPFEKINNEEFPNANFNMVYYIKPLASNFLIGMKKGLFLYNPDKHEFKHLDETKKYTFLFEDVHSNMIVSSQSGPSILRNNQLIPINKVYPEWTAFKTTELNSATLLNDSIYAIGSENNRGILLWNYKNKCIQILNTNSTPIKLSSNIINKVYQDHLGNLWILSDLGIDVISKSFTKIDHLHFKDKKNNIDAILYFDICETNESIWLTSYGLGLIQLNKNRELQAIYNTEQGLSCNGVYKVFNYQNKMLVISTNNGVSTFDISNSQFHNFYETDGLHSNSFEENSGIEYKGKFIVGGLNGFTIIDPSLIKINNNTPKLYIDKIELESPFKTIDTSNILLSQMDIPSDVIRVGLSLSAIHFTNPLKTKIAYKIDEINNHWISAEDRGMIQLLGLSPGTYTIRIKSANEHGFWNETPIIIKLRFLPKWYQSIWFRLLIALLIVSAAYTLYRFRINQIKKQLTIRRSIASDLHDDIGSSLHTVKVFAHLAKREKDNIRYLDEIELALTTASTGMRDMIWVLDDSNDDTWKELIERIKKGMLPLLSSQQIKLKVDAEESVELESISKEEKKNLLLIAKEAINNSVKYSKCTLVHISLKKLNGKIEFTISDNGIGFDTQNLTEGNGIKNMHYRASLIRYHIIYISIIGQGTDILLKKE
jgi:ligand-binding sensor domain-containing protein/signal transduction histidine kinase